MDKIIAKEIPDIDVIVGGGSETFLYSGILYEFVKRWEIAVIKQIDKRDAFFLLSYKIFLPFFFQFLT